MWGWWEYEVSMWWVLWLGVTSPVLRWMPVLVYGLVCSCLLHGLVFIAVTWSPRIRSCVARWLLQTVKMKRDNGQGFGWHFLYLLGARSIIVAIFKNASKHRELSTILNTANAAEAFGGACPPLNLQFYVNRVVWGINSTRIYCPVCRRCPFWLIHRGVQVYLEEFVREWRVFKNATELPDLLSQWLRMSYMTWEWNMSHLEWLEDAFDHPHVFLASFTGHFISKLSHSEGMAEEAFRNRFLKITLDIIESDERPGLRKNALYSVTSGPWGQNVEALAIIISRLPAIIRRHPQQLSRPATAFITSHHKEILRQEAHAQLRETLFWVGRKHRKYDLLHRLTIQHDEEQWIDLFVTEGLAALIRRNIRGSSWWTQVGQLRIFGVWVERMVNRDGDVYRILLRDAEIGKRLERVLPPQAAVNHQVVRDRIESLLPQLRRPLSPSLADKLPTRVSNRRIAFELF